MKLFQNLATDLAEEVVKSLFLFIALAAILFNVAESFEQFWQRVTQQTFLYNYFKIHPLVQEKKSLKVFQVLALAAILFKEAEWFEQFWYRVTQGTFLLNYFTICLAILEEKSFKAKS